MPAPTYIKAGFPLPIAPVDPSSAPPPRLMAALQLRAEQQLNDRYDPRSSATPSLEGAAACFAP